MWTQPSLHHLFHVWTPPHPQARVISTALTHSFTVDCLKPVCLPVLKIVSFISLCPVTEWTLSVDLAGNIHKMRHCYCYNDYDLEGRTILRQIFPCFFVFCFALFFWLDHPRFRLEPTYFWNQCGSPETNASWIMWPENMNVKLYWRLAGHQAPCYVL